MDEYLIATAEAYCVKLQLQCTPAEVEGLKYVVAPTASTVVSGSQEVSMTRSIWRDIGVALLTGGLFLILTGLIDSFGSRKRPQNR